MKNNLTLNDLFPGKYLKTADIPEDSDLVLTISGLEVEEIGSDREKKYILSFVETEKCLVLNKTNGTTIAGIYGQRIDDWIGKQITLYTTEVNFRGETLLGIRIRLRAPNTRRLIPPQETSGQNHEQFQF